MRLIDIKDVKHGFMEKSDLDEETIQNIIDELPTAYDVDKVNDQLEEKSTCFECNDGEGYTMILLDDAKGIVRAGGKHD